MARPGHTAAAPGLQLPRRRRDPLTTLAIRFGAASGIVLLVALLTFLERSGYHDAGGGTLSPLDTIYYATVTLTTTGYGDIYPASAGARATTAFVVTPLRIVFLVLLVGTTVEILTESTRQVLRVRRWRSAVRDHVIICGYGAKAASAVEALTGNGMPLGRIVVIEPDADRAESAMQAGHPVVRDSSTRTRALQEADLDTAASLIVTTDGDDTAVLTILTARDINPSISIAATLSEEENAHLLRRSGADIVIPSTSASGRLVGIATFAPDLVGVFEDLLTVGRGIDLVERPVAAGETSLTDSTCEHVILVLREGESLLWNDPRAEPLRPDDRLVEIMAVPGPARADQPAPRS